MEDVPDIKQGGAVALPQVTHGKEPERPCPSIPRLNAQGMTPGVVCVELRAVPLPLTPVHLKGVIVAKARIGQVARRLAGIVRVGLEEVNRIAVSRIRYAVQGAGRETRA